MQWRRFKKRLFAGWRGYGHLSRGVTLGQWVYRATVYGLGGGLSTIAAIEALWGLVLVLTGGTVALAVLAFFLDRPRNRPLIGWRLVGQGQVRVPGDHEGVVLFLQIINRERPTVLTGWKVIAHHGRHAVPLEVAYDRIPSRWADSKQPLPLRIGTSLVHKTFSEPVGHVPVAGYLIAYGPGLTREFLDAPQTTFEVRCFDMFNRTWTVESPDGPTKQWRKTEIPGWFHVTD